MASESAESLQSFIRAAKADGMEDSSVVAILRQRGWSERRIYAALSAYYEARVGPIPGRPVALESARDAFLYLLAFVTLGIWTVAFVWLTYSLIDHFLPSALDTSVYYAYRFRESVAGQLASLIIAFPIFIFVSRLIVLEVVRRPEALESGIRKWLTYIALVLTAITLVCDGVAFLQQFLLGDLTIRFALKALVLFVLAAAVFWYYLGSVRSSEVVSRRDAVYAWCSIVVVAIVVALGFYGIGSPGFNRSIAADNARVRAIHSLAIDIESSYRETESHALPATSASIDINQPELWRDPVSMQRYEYSRESPQVFQLCAVFDAPSVDIAATYWRHQGGRYCFTFDVRQGIPAM